MKDNLDQPQVASARIQMPSDEYMSAPVISYEPFDQLIESLRSDGFANEADRLHFLIYEVAWTTGSELIGELGQEIKAIAQEQGDDFSSKTRSKIGDAMRIVERVWPDFPQ